MLRRNAYEAVRSKHPKLRHIQSNAVHKPLPSRPQKRRLHSSHRNDQLENREELEQRVTRSKGSINDELYHRMINGSEPPNKRSADSRRTLSKVSNRSNHNLNHSSNDIQQPALKRPKHRSNKKDVIDVTPKRCENRRCDQIKRDMPNRNYAVSVTRSDKHSTGVISMKRIDNTQAPSSSGESKYTVNGSHPTTPDDQANNDHATRSPSMKTRGWTKMKKRLIPHCRVCKRDTKTLIKCLSCGAQYHLECLEYDSDALGSVLEKRSCDWLCPKCIVCTSCAQFITDKENVQCVSCDRAYHGTCKPNTTSKSIFPVEPFFCFECMPSHQTPLIKNELIDSSSSTCTPQSLNDNSSGLHSSKTSNSSISHMRIRTKRTNGNGRRSATIAKQALQQFRDKVNDRLKDKASAILNRQQQTAKLRRTTSPNGIKTHQSPRMPTLATSRMDLESNSPQRVKEREESSSSSSDEEDENNANVQSSSSKKQLFVDDRLGLNKNTLEQCTASDDFQLFMNAKKQLADEMNDKQSTEELSTPTLTPVTTNKDSNNNINQIKDCWIHYANYKMKALNESPFPKAIARAEHLFVCHFCLTPMTSRDRYEIHMQHCNWYHPPGNEIYRDDDVSFWEIDGADDVKYCTRLCLLSILLLPSKVAYRDMETFIFYLLTEKTNDGHVLVGYFSKEKQPSQNNNLSCLLVFPMVQRAGYGKMLIDLSYKLSLKERKIGGPEHPLSNLGLLTYRSYWKAIIVSYIRSIRGRFNISIKEMSNATGIHIEDIIATLTLYNLLKSTNDSYYVDVKRVLRLPLRSFRYRAVKDEKLIWEPSFDVDKDPTKMGTYND